MTKAGCEAIEMQLLSRAEESLESYNGLTGKAGLEDTQGGS